MGEDMKRITSARTATSQTAPKASARTAAPRATRKASPRTFLSYYFSYFVRPGRTFEALRDDPRKARMAVLAMLIPSLGYTLMYTCAWFAGGAPSTVQPWIALPMAEYFKYDIFIAAPSMFLGWILAAGVVQLLAGIFSGAADKGTFEDTAAAVAFGIAVGTWASLVHDLTDGVLGVLGVINMREYEAALNGPTFWRGLLWTLYTIYALWMAFLFTKGFRRAHRLGWAPSVLLAVGALVIYAGFFFVFNR